jgi:CRISPR-associated endonuclease/helicase Cas3
MCAQHRRDVLAKVRKRLEDGESCRLVSTQLIEAGVDVDFPVVYRAPAGFDSIAQAAGRCNREGRLAGEEGRPAMGRVYVFDTKTPPPPGMLRQTAEKAKELFDAHTDPLAASAVEAYFRLFYWSRQHEWDKHGVMPCFGYPQAPKLPPFQFRQAAEAYKIIREEQTPVLVPYNAEARRIRARLLRGGEIDFQLLRKAQRYTVSLRGERKDSGSIDPGSPLARLVEAGVVQDHPSGMFILQNDAAYSPEKGMSFDASGFGPESLMG